MAEEFADIAEYAVRAERYVFDDPNTSLMKSRQFAEFLCNFVARRNGLDPADLNFQAVEQLLARQRLVSRPVRENFRQIRTWGNSASHAGFSERQIGLAALITAFDLAVWFFRTFVDDQFAPGPFRPPPNPVNIEEELRLELDVLRDELAQHQQQLETAQGESIEQDEIRHNLERESQARFRSLEEASNTLANTQASREQEQHEFEKQLATLRLTVEAVAQEDLQELAYRSRRAAEMIGLYGDYIEYVPSDNFGSGVVRNRDVVNTLRFWCEMLTTIVSCEFVQTAGSTKLSISTCFVISTSGSIVHAVAVG